MVIRTLYTLGDLATSPKPVEDSLESQDFPQQRTSAVPQDNQNHFFLVGGMTSAS